MGDSACRNIFASCSLTLHEIELLLYPILFSIFLVLIIFYRLSAGTVYEQQGMTQSKLFYFPCSLIYC